MKKNRIVVQFKRLVMVLLIGCVAGIPGFAAADTALNISGPDSVAHHPFTVLVPGAIKAEISWTGDSSELRARLLGREPGVYAEIRGKSPLVLAYDVKDENVRRGVNWRLVIDDPAGGGDARISLKLDMPEDREARADFDRRKIILRSGEFLPSADLQKEFMNRLERSNGAGVHGLIVLRRAVTRQDIKILERKGVRRQSFLSKRHSVGLIEHGFRPGDPQVAEMLKAIVPLEPQDKVDPDLWVGNYRHFEILENGVPQGINRALNRDGSLNLRVKFYPDTREQNIREELGQLTQKFSPKSDNLWQVTIASDKLQVLADKEQVEWIEAGEKPLLLLNDTTRAAINVDPLQDATVNAGANTIAYAGLTGAGITIGIHDSGVDAGHNDLNVIRDVSGSASHGTHVAGIAAGSGIQSALIDDFGNPNGGTAFQYRGMAPNASIVDWAGLIDAANTLDSITNDSLDLVNHSHVLSFGGNYDADCALIDQLVRGEATSGGTPVPRRPRIFAAGNNGSSPQYGWIFGYFSTLNQAKNCVMVGSWDAGTGFLSNFSSMGPAFDGRLVPDVLAPGSNVISCHTSNRYVSKSGTSMASPAVAGVHGLLLEAWQNTYNVPLGLTVDSNPPLPSTLRAILIQTATDIVSNDVRNQVHGEIDSDSNAGNGNDGSGRVSATVGPDFSTGFGMIDAQAAVNLLENARMDGGVPIPNQIVQDTVNQGAMEEFEFVVEAAGPVRITLAWDDIEAAVQLPGTSPCLINDLDLELVSPQGDVFYPWQLGQTILDSVGNPIADEDQLPGTAIQVQIPISPNLLSGSDYIPASAITGTGVWVAGTGKDHLNNVEQVSIPNAMAGRWTARVIGFDIPTGAQDFSLVGMPYPDLPELVGSNEEKVGIPGLSTDFTFDWSVSNIGTAATGGSFEYTVLLSADFQLGGDVPLTIQSDSVAPDGTIGALGAGDSAAITTTVQITPAQASALLGISSGSVTVADLVENDVFLLVYYDSAGSIPEHDEVNIIPVQVARLVDVVLVMDRSGSMGAEVPVSNGTQTKLEQLKKSTKLFLDLMRTNEGDRLGEVSFASTESIDFDEPGAIEMVTELTSGPGGNLNTAKSEVDALSAGGATNIRDALQTGLDLLPPGSDRRKVLVFLSDGMKTAGGDPTESAFLNQFSAEDVNVFSVGFGTEGGSGLAGLDLNLLSTLSTQGPDGLFHVAENSTQLDKFFIEALGGAIESELVVDPEGDLAPGQSVEVDAGLGSKDLTATFIATWDDPAASLQLTLRSPTGLLITEGNAASFGDKVQFTRQPGYVFARIKPPLPSGPSSSHAGTWSMIIRNGGRITTHYMANVLADSTAHFSLATPLPAGRTSYEPGDHIEFSALLRGAAPGALRQAVIKVQPFVPAIGIGEVFSSKALTAEDLANVPLAINKEPLSVLERMGMAYQLKYGEPPVSKLPAAPFTLSLEDLMKDSALFQGAFPAPVPGEYSFLIRASVLDENCEPINREILHTVWVAPKPDPGTTEVVIDAQPPTYLVKVTPRDRVQGHVGPGYADRFELVGKGVRQIGPVQDMLDGTYLIALVRETREGGALEISFQGVALAPIVFDQGTGPSDPVSTPAGQRVGVALGSNLALEFGEVLEAGQSTLTLNEGPDSLKGLLGAAPLAFEVSTTANFGSSDVDVMVGYEESHYADERNLILVQKQGDAWIEITTDLDVTSNVVRGRTSLLSEFAVLEMVQVEEAGQLSLGRNGAGEMEITTPGGRFYYLQYAEDLNSPWERISPAFNGILMDHDPGRLGRKSGFYRLEVRQPSASNP